MSEDRPNIFLSFPDFIFERGLARRLWNNLDRRGIDLYILTEDARIGESWLDTAKRHIDLSDGVMMIWTGRAAQSKVAQEFEYAESKHVPIALLLEEGVEPPTGYPKDRVYARLSGYNALFRVGKYRVLGTTTEPYWSKLLDQLTVFAWRNAAKKALESRSPRLESYVYADTKYEVTGSYKP